MFDVEADLTSFVLYLVENYDIPGAPQPCGVLKDCRGIGHLLRCEGEAEQSVGELPRCSIQLQRQPGEFKALDSVQNCGLCLLLYLC